MLGLARGAHPLFHRVAFAAICLSAAPSPVCAQRAAAAPAVQAPAAAAQAPVVTASERRADDTRHKLNELLQEHPPAVREVLQREPALLANAEYLAPYPRLAAFVAAHPEIGRSPAYFLGEPYRSSRDDSGTWMWRELLDAISLGAVLLGVALGFGWLMRTALDHRRWQRVSKIQVETHSKLLDRMTASEDLRAYMESPAGRQFLESAPIALDSGSSPLAAPVSRILWSMQVGVVALFLGLALNFVSRSQIDEVGQPLYVLGVLVMAIGGGFLFSAGLAYVLSRRLGLLRDDGAPAATTLPRV